MLALVFGVEMGIMLLFMWFPTVIEGDLARSVVDALTLTAVVSPAFWLLIVGPLRAMFDERGRLLSRLFRAQEDERASLSRDLHDELGQQLTVILLRLGAAERATELSVAKESVRDVHAMTVRSLESVRRLARGLGPGVLTGLGLGAAIGRLCEDFSASSGLVFELEYKVPEAERFAPEVEISVYRIVQEACTNIVRHAGAEHAKVVVLIAGGVMRVVIRDDGRGLVGAEQAGSGQAGSGKVAAGQPGLGLPGIRERALSLGGHASVTSRRGAGTVIEVEIPVVRVGTREGSRV
jgi:two-component system sensor histidine kinase UhpB